MKQKKGAPAGGLHSANRFYGNTTQGGLHSWDAIKMSTANRTCALCLIDLTDSICDHVFCDGLSDYCVTSFPNYFFMPVDVLVDRLFLTARHSHAYKLAW